MITCESFRTRFHSGTEDAALLAHLRACDRCLDFAATADPDVMFRALGGDELVPPGGVDAFVDDVMRQVRVRGAENTVHAPHAASWTRRFAVAATVAAAVTGATLVYRYDAPATLAPRRATPSVRATPVAQVALVSKPVVERYESDTATILEVPTEPNDDVTIVMIFDENLPADL